MTSDVLRPLRFFASLLAGAALCLALPTFADAAAWSGAAVTPKPERFILSSERQHLYRYAFVVRQGVARSAPHDTAQGGRPENVDRRAEHGGADRESGDVFSLSFGHGRGNAQASAISRG